MKARARAWPIPPGEHLGGRQLVGTRVGRRGAEGRYPVIRIDLGGGDMIGIEVRGGSEMEGRNLVIRRLYTCASDLLINDSASADCSDI